MTPVLEQVAHVAEHVESLAAQVRTMDDEAKFHLIDLNLGVTEPYTFGDILDVIAMGLRGICADGHDGPENDGRADP